MSVSGRVDDSFFRDWTIFYWGWWIAWSPFTGIFIARISRGRTIREFLLGVLGAPTVLTILWITIFGNTAMHIELFGDGGVAAAVNAGQIRLFDGEFFENMGVYVLVKTFRIFVFYLEFHVFEFGNTRF